MSEVKLIAVAYGKVDTAVIKVYGTHCQTERTVVACVGPLLTIVLVEKVNSRHTSLYLIGLQNFLEAVTALQVSRTSSTALACSLACKCCGLLWFLKLYSYGVAGFVHL